MPIRHRVALFAAASGIALSGAIAAAPAMAADSPSTTPAPAPSKTSPTMVFMTRGTVAALNGRKLTVAGDNGQNLVTVAPDATVTLNGATAKLAQLPIGAQIAVSGTVNGDAKVATRIEANTAVPFAVAGSVTAVDGTARTVTVLGLTGVSKVYPVAAKAMITLDLKTADLAKLPVRAHILVAGTVTGGVYSAQSVTAVSRWDMKLSGIVAAVDATHGTVTVSTGTTAAPVKLNVDPAASIQVNGVKASLASLPIGATVNLSGSESTTGTSILGIQATANSGRKSR
jgi:hypothetical protein